LGPAKTATAPDWNQWQLEPGVVLLVAFLAIGYAVAAGPYRQALLRLGGRPPAGPAPGTLAPERYGRLTAWQAATYFCGVLLAALALLSPLHTLGERYLLTAHMVQHLVITMLVPPLLLLGTPGWMLRPLLRFRLVRALGRRLFVPIPAFALFNVVFTIWHVPALYEWALVFPPAHALEHVLFLALGIVTWWPVLGPLAEFPRLPYGVQVLYLFFQSLPPTILGAIIALAEIPIYPTYWQAPRVSGLGPLEDQQLAGLIMWIPGALIYFVALSVVFFLWLERRESTGAAPYGVINPNRAGASSRATASAPRR
jgi:putative membrane protein